MTETQDIGIVGAVQKALSDPLQPVGPYPPEPTSKRRPSTAVALATPMEMLGFAISKGQGVEVIERLMALQERWEAGEARKAFNNALADAKADLPPIVKNRAVDFTNDSGDRTYFQYENLPGLLSAIEPVLSKHGLFIRFRASSEVEKPIVVTCIVGHRDGHTEETTLSGPRDDSPGKRNALQKIGSSITYLQRYALKAALGLAAAPDDDAMSLAMDEPEIEAAFAKFSQALVLAADRPAVNSVILAINADPHVDAIKERLRGAVDAAKTRTDPKRVPTPEELVASSQKQP